MFLLAFWTEVASSWEEMTVAYQELVFAATTALLHLEVTNLTTFVAIHTSEYVLGERAH